jgi:nitrogen fixation/metabolism regulation signal transduction histidine kinase
VSCRRFCGLAKALFDPSTYTWANFEAAKEQAKQNRKFLLMVTLVAMTPVVLVYPFSIQRALTARNRYLMHQLMKKRFIETSLSLESKKMKLSELKKVLQQDPLNYS